MIRRALPVALALLLPAAASAQEKGKPAPTTVEGPAARLDAAKAAAKERKVRILAVVTEDFYDSAPCRRLEKALEDPAAREALAAFVPLRAVEKEDLALSKALGLDDLGHPFTAILDAEGRPVAWLRGAFDGPAWAKEVRRLAAAADAVEARRAAAEKAPADPKALWELSEALRAAGRVREADDALSRSENADPEGKSGLLPLFRFRRLEARVEDRMAAQDFDGTRTLLDAYDREFPTSPRRPWVAFYRAVARALRGETDGALDDLREVAAGAKEKDPELAALAEARVAALEKVIDRKR
jgi:hypothetical protein